jgi:hypothetical protein
MLKYCALLPVLVLAFACGSSDDGDDQGALGTGGTRAIGVTGGSAGSSTIGVGGGSSSGGSQGSGASSGTSSTILPETAETLRKKACAARTGEAEVLPTVLQLVVDSSFSMNDRPRNSNETKWDITSDALETAIDGLPSTTAVGMLFYPNRSTQAGRPEDEPRDIRECVNVDAMIPIETLAEDGSAHRRELARAIEDAGPNGSTPTHDAYRYAYQNGMLASDLTGNRFMLLITDGAPTFALQCTGGGGPNDPQPTQPIIDDIRAAREEGVRTFIIGSPGSESVNGVDVRAWLAEAAVRGGTARSGCSLNGPDYCHIDLSQNADFAGALNAAFARILGQIISCSFELPDPPPGEVLNTEQINVIYSSGSGGTETLLGRNEDPNCTEGWQLDDSNKLTLCPATCDLVKANPQARIELLFGCDTVDVEPVR